MDKHTPGKWESRISDDGLLQVWAGDECLAYFGDMEETDGSDHANADMMASAPELLARIKALEGALHSTKTLLHHAKWYDNHVEVDYEDLAQLKEDYEALDAQGDK